MGVFVLPDFCTDLLLLGNLFPYHCPCINLHTALKWLVLQHPIHNLPYAGHCLWRCPVLQYLHLASTFCFLSLTLSSFFIFFLMESQTLAQFILFSTSFCALWSSTLQIHNNTHSLVASPIFSNAGISLSISLMMPSSSSPHMNCLVNLLSYFL